MTRSSELFFKYLGPQISLKNGSLLKTNLWMSGFKWDLPQTMGAFNFLKNQTETMVKPLKVFLKGCIMDFAWFLQKLEASMIGVCLICDLTSKGPFWVLNHFWGIFAGWDIWKTNLNFWSIINFQCIFVYFQNQRSKTIWNSEHFTKFLGLIYQNIIVSVKIWHTF